MLTLQGEGVPAAKVRAPYELLEEPQLLEREFFERIEREYVGIHPHSQAPYKISRDARDRETPTPCLGEHNEKVLCGLLGIKKEDLAELEAKGVIRDDKNAQGTQE